MANWMISYPDSVLELFLDHGVLQYRGRPRPRSAAAKSPPCHGLRAHELRVMGKRNVTVVLEEESAHWIRVEAARRNTSVSKYLGELVDGERRRCEGYLAAQKRFMAREPRALGPAGEPLPSRAELHER